MTTYTTITNALVAVGAKPFATTIQALRDNPIAIGEADATVPAGLLPTVLLGTVTTTSGTSQTLSSLILTPYRFLLLWGIGVDPSGSATAGNVVVGSLSMFSSTRTTPGAFMVWIDLATGTGIAMGNPEVSGASGITNVSTSITFTAAQTFAAGSIKVYGVK